MQKYCLNPKAKAELRDIWFVTYHVGGVVLALIAGILASVGTILLIVGTPKEIAESTIVVYMAVAFWVTALLYILYSIFRWGMNSIEPC